MEPERVGKAVDAALLPIVSSLGSSGVRRAHWLPDRDGAPVVWLETGTEAERRALESQVWLLPQVQITLTRLGVPHDIVWRLRIEVTSGEAEEELFRDGPLSPP